MPSESKRMELVVEREGGSRNVLVGLGLLASPIVGFIPLQDALSGSGPFEYAMGRFLLCVLACVVAARVIGAVVDSSPRTTTNSDEAADGADTGPDTDPEQ